ncbi:MAG: hypothetical protein ACP5U0_08205 [Caldisphaera sp.]
MARKYKEKFDWVVFYGYFLGLRNDTASRNAVALGDTYLLASLIQSAKLHRGMRIGLIVQKKFEKENFIQILRMFSMVEFEAVQSDDIFIRHTVYISEKSNLFYRVITNVYYMMIFLFFNAIQLIHMRDYSDSSKFLKRNFNKKFSKLEYILTPVFTLGAYIPFVKRKLPFEKPDLISADDIIESQRIFKKLGLTERKTVFINLETHGGRKIYEETPITLEEIIKTVKECGLEYVINTNDLKIIERFGNSIYLPLNLLIPFSELCGNIIAFRSGMVDILSNTKTKKVIFYNGRLVLFMLLDKNILLHSEILQFYIDNNTDIRRIYDEIKDFLINYKP